MAKPKKNSIVFIIVVLLFLSFIKYKAPTQTIIARNDLSECLDRRTDIISGYSSSDPYWVSPCYLVNSNMDSCSSYFDYENVGEYIFGYERFGRGNLDMYEQQAIQCAEQYGAPNPSVGNCGAGKTYLNGWCFYSTVCTIPGDTPPACDGIDRAELGQAISKWIAGTMTRAELGQAIVSWVS